MHKVFIGIPTMNGIAKIQTLWTVAETVARLERAGITTKVATRDGGAVSRSRDSLAHSFLASEASHLLFVDSDIWASPDLCSHLLASKKPLVGTIYAQRHLNLQHVSGHIERGMNLNDALLMTYAFAARYPSDNKVTVSGPLCRVDGIGLGFTLIARECLTALLKSGNLPTRARIDPRDPGKVLPSFFAEIADTTEDYSFCERWRALGGEVWAYADADIRHIGDFQYGLPFSQRLQLEAARQNP